MLYYEKQLTLW